MAEQTGLIEVPKIVLQDQIPQRTTLRNPLLVEQLVEVPTVVSYSFLQQQLAEQNVDIPVPSARLRLRGDLQGFLTGQGSTASRGGLASAPIGGDLLGLVPGQQRLMEVLLPRHLVVEHTDRNAIPYHHRATLESDADGHLKRSEFVKLGTCENHGMRSSVSPRPIARSSDHATTPIPCRGDIEGVPDVYRLCRSAR